MTREIWPVLAVIALAIPFNVVAEERSVFPGAIIYHSEINSRTAALNSLSQTERHHRARATSAFSYHIDVPIADMPGSNLHHWPYLRKLNPCRRARARRFMKDLGVRARCSPNWAMHAISVVPDDPFLKNQWAVNSMELPDAWQTSTGSDQVVVAVVDSGVAVSHPDLVDNIWNNPGEIPADGIDNDGNGYIDDVHGWNAISNSGQPDDDNGHGTHVAGIIGASGNNGIGISGVAWNVKIMPLKFLNSAGSGSLSDAIECLEYVRVMKTRGVNIVVTNNSWGGQGSITSHLTNTVERLANSGILFVAAAGNSALNNDLTAILPGSLPSTNMITVASVTSQHKLSSFSNFGLLKVHIAAPGSGILSTYPGEGVDAAGRYASLDGTSMAAPQVSGVAALISALGPLSMTERRSIILSSGTRVASLSNSVSTSSIVNAKNAVLGAFQALGGIATPTIPPSPTNIAKPGRPTPSPVPTPAGPKARTLGIQTDGRVVIGSKISIIVRGADQPNAYLSVRFAPLNGRPLRCRSLMKVPVGPDGTGARSIRLTKLLVKFPHISLSWKTASGTLEEQLTVNARAKRKLSKQKQLSERDKVCRTFNAG